MWSDNSFQTIDTVREMFDDIFFEPGYDEDCENIWDAFLFGMATVIANRFFTPPSWLIYLAYPSTFKSTIIDFLEGLDRWDHVYPLGNPTLNAFLSGGPKREGHVDIAERIGNKATFLINDLATFLGDSKDNLKKKMGDLTSIYDRKLVRPSPVTGEERKFDKHVGLLGATTPGTVGMNIAWLSMIGNRFLFYTFPRAPDDYAFKLKKKNDMILKKKINQIKEIVAGFLRPIINGKIPTFYREDDEIMGQLERAAAYLKYIRGDGSPIRAIEQFVNILRAYEYVKTGGTSISLETARDKVIPFLPEEAADGSHHIIRALLTTNDRTEIRILKARVDEISGKKKDKWLRRRVKKLTDIGILDSYSVLYETIYRLEVELVPEYRKIFEKRYNQTTQGDVLGFDSYLKKGI